LVEELEALDGFEEEAGGMSRRVSVRVRESVKLRRSWRRVLGRGLRKGKR